MTLHRSGMGCYPAARSLSSTLQALESVLCGVILQRLRRRAFSHYRIAKFARCTAKSPLIHRKTYLLHCFSSKARNAKPRMTPGTLLVGEKDLIRGIFC